MIHQEVPAIFQNKKLIALDIETTGLNILYNTIIELGVIEINQGKVTTEYTKLFGGGHSSMFLVRKIHHIKDSERIGKKTFKDCAEKISNFLSDSIIVTYNGNSFDIPMIQQKLKETGNEIKNFKSLDVLQLVKKMRKGEESQGKSNSLKNVCKEFDLVYGGEQGNRSHRGLEDAQATLDLLFYLINNKKVSL